jgi:RNA polymerase sigma-70 factor, ECF subfamily
LPSHGLDPQLALLRTRYGAEVNAAFKGAFRALSPRERTLLRQHHLHGVGLEQLAALHRVHRVTLARWLGKARTTLLAQTRAVLADKLALSDSRLDSIIELVRSQLALSSTDAAEKP